jgi:hypothetical protein
LVTGQSRLGNGLWSSLASQRIRTPVFASLEGVVGYLAGELEADLDATRNQRFGSSKAGDSRSKAVDLLRIAQKRVKRADVESPGTGGRAVAIHHVSESGRNGG